jgi:hypothetical protein
MDGWVSKMTWHDLREETPHLTSTSLGGCHVAFGGPTIAFVGMLTFPNLDVSHVWAILIVFSFITHCKG